MSGAKPSVAVPSPNPLLFFRLCAVLALVFLWRETFSNILHTTVPVSYALPTPPLLLAEGDAFRCVPSERFIPQTPLNMRLPVLLRAPSGGTTHSPTIFAYISAMSAIKMAGQWREGLGLLDEMDDAGLVSDVFR